MSKTGIRYPRSEIARIGDILIASIRPHVVKVCYVGSYRRMLPDCGDGDILCIPRDSKAASAAFAALCPTGLETGSGEGLDVGEIDGVPFNLFYTDSDHWGAALLYSTGSKEYNISTRTVAKRHGLKLTQDGLFTRSGKLITPGESEGDICRALGIPWLPPEQRTGSAYRPGSRER